MSQRPVFVASAELRSRLPAAALGLLIAVNVALWPLITFDMREFLVPWVRAYRHARADRRFRPSFLELYSDLPLPARLGLALARDHLVCELGETGVVSGNVVGRLVRLPSAEGERKRAGPVGCSRYASHSDAPAQRRVLRAVRRFVGGTVPAGGRLLGRGKTKGHAAVVGRCACVQGASHLPGARSSRAS